MKNTDLAVALKIDDFSGIPSVIAKAKGILVKKLLSIAENNNIEIYKDEDLAHALYAINIDSDISPELYKSVVEVLVYCYNINNDLKQKIDSKILGKRDK